jgi:hypothetical protein
MAPILGGADFDGDLVKLIKEPIINDAVCRGAYDGSPQKRSLPVVVIPSTTAKDKVIPLYVDYMTVRDSFANNVGRISNKAIDCGRKFYTALDAGKDTAGLIDPAYCTIMTGLEIDAAKTGEHPSLDWLDENDPTKRFKDPYLEKKGQMDKKRKWTKQKQKALAVTGDEENYTLQMKKSGDVLFDAKMPEKGKTAAIDMLPYLCLKAIANIGEILSVDEELPETKFVFEQENWKKELDVEKRRQIKLLNAAYKGIFKTMSLMTQRDRKLETVNYSNRIYTNMLIKDGRNVALSDGSTVPLDLVIEDIYSKLTEILNSAVDAEKVKQAVCSIPWYTVGYMTEDENGRAEERSAALKDMLNSYVDENISGLLCDFCEQGYMNLYYFIMDIICMYESEEPSQTDFSPQDMKDNVYYGKMNEIYKQLRDGRASGNLVRSRINDYCRSVLKELFGDMDEALRYVYAEGKKEKLFWEVFSAAEICGNI